MGQPDRRAQGRDRHSAGELQPGGCRGTHQLGLEDLTGAIATRRDGGRARSSARGRSISRSSGSGSKRLTAGGQVLSCETKLHRARVEEGGGGRRAMGGAGCTSGAGWRARASCRSCRCGQVRRASLVRLDPAGTRRSHSVGWRSILSSRRVGSFKVIKGRRRGQLRRQACAACLRDQHAQRLALLHPEVVQRPLRTLERLGLVAVGSLDQLEAVATQKCCRGQRGVEVLGHLEQDRPQGRRGEEAQRDGRRIRRRREDERDVCV